MSIPENLSTLLDVMERSAGLNRSEHSDSYQADLRAAQEHLVLITTKHVDGRAELSDADLERVVKVAALWGLQELVAPLTQSIAASKA